MTDQPDLLTTSEAAEYTRQTVNTLAVLRYKGKGPRYIRPEGTRKVLYERSELDAWLAGGVRQGTAPEAASA